MQICYLSFNSLNESGILQIFLQLSSVFKKFASYVYFGKLKDTSEEKFRATRANSVERKSYLRRAVNLGSIPGHSHVHRRGVDINMACVGLMATALLSEHYIN